MLEKPRWQLIFMYGLAYAFLLLSWPQTTTSRYV
jgi:hypothetical protein